MVPYPDCGSCDVKLANFIMFCNIWGRLTLGESSWEPTLETPGFGWGYQSASSRLLGATWDQPITLGSLSSARVLAILVP